MTDFKRLGDIATYINGYAFKPEDRGTEGLPIIRIQDLTGNSYDLGFYNGEYPERIEINNGDVLISWSGSLGVYLWNKGKALLNQHIFKVVFDKAEIDKSYFIYAIQHYLKEMEAKTHGATMKHITKKDFDDMLVPYPNMQKQRETAGILSMVDGIIVSCQQELTKLDELVKSRFVEMFEKGEFERIPFDSFCEFLRNGASIKQTKGAGGYPITRIETLANDTFNIDRLGYANITELKGVEKYILQKGDILISHINSVAYLGRAVQYRGESNTPIIHGMNLLCARLRNDCNSTYVEYFFKTPMAKDYISTITKKAVNQASITTTDLKKMPIPDPPLELQNRFSAFVAEVDKSKLAVKQSLEKLETLKKSLMQQYFG